MDKGALRIIEFPTPLSYTFIYRTYLGKYRTYILYSWRTTAIQQLWFDTEKVGEIVPWCLCCWGHDFRAEHGLVFGGGREAGGAPRRWTRQTGTARFLWRIWGEFHLGVKWIWPHKVILSSGQGDIWKFTHFKKCWWKCSQKKMSELVGRTLNQRYPEDGPAVQMKAMSENPWYVQLKTNA